MTHVYEDPWVVAKTADYDFSTARAAHQSVKVIGMSTAGKWIISRDTRKGVPPETVEQARGRLALQALLNLRIRREVEFLGAYYAAPEGHEAAGEVLEFQSDFPAAPWDWRSTEWRVPSTWTWTHGGGHPEGGGDKFRSTTSEDGGPYTVLETENGTSCSCKRGVESHAEDTGIEGPCQHKAGVALYRLLYGLTLDYIHLPDGVDPYLMLESLCYGHTTVPMQPGMLDAFRQAGPEAVEEVLLLLGVAGLMPLDLTVDAGDAGDAGSGVPA